MKKKTTYGVLLGLAFVVLTAAGASRYINGTEIPQSVTLLYSSGAQSATLGAVTATSLGVSGAVGITGALGVTGLTTMSGGSASDLLTKLGNQAATAGTTQTQAGATAITDATVTVTNGNAGDGVALPAGSDSQCVVVYNSSATNALRVYGANADNDTIQGNSADVHVTQAAGATCEYCTANGVAWTARCDNQLMIPDNAAIGAYLLESADGTDILRVTTTNSAEGVTVDKFLTVTGAFTASGSLAGANELYLTDVTANATADVSSAQGGGAMTTTVLRVGTSANAGDAITLPAAVAGLCVMVGNSAAANSIDLFPASGDAIGNASANAALAIAANKAVFCCAVDTTNWICAGP